MTVGVLLDGQETTVLRVITCLPAAYYQPLLYTYIFFICHNIAICSDGCVNGVCIGPDDCMCSAGWTGNNCTQGN